MGGSVFVPAAHNHTRRDAQDHLVIYEPEAHIVRLMFDWVTGGLSVTHKFERPSVPSIPIPIETESLSSELGENCTAHPVVL